MVTMVTLPVAMVTLRYYGNAVSERQYVIKCLTVDNLVRIYLIFNLPSFCPHLRF